MDYTMKEFKWFDGYDLSCILELYEKNGYNDKWLGNHF